MIASMVVTVDSEGGGAGVLPEDVGDPAGVVPGVLRRHLLQDQLVGVAAVHAGEHRLLLRYLHVAQVPTQIVSILYFCFNTRI